MKPIKIAFFDIDGTLIDFGKHTMSEKVTEALKQLKENGIILCIATGRPLKSIPEFEDIEFDAFLAFNSSYCCNQQEVIYKQPIPKEDVCRIIENAKRINRPVSIASAFRMGANGKDLDLVDYYALSGQQVEVIEDFDDLKKEDIYQIMMGCYEEEYDKVLEGVNGAKITAWWPRAVDIIPSDGGKGIGVEKILEYYHLSKEEAIAFGDGANDIEMLQAVGLGVAMENAKDEVKEIADDICESVSKDGVYWYCKKIRLI